MDDLPPTATGSDLVELPIQWVLDDAPYFWFTGGMDWTRSIQTPSRVREIWTGELDGDRGAGRLLHRHDAPAGHRPAAPAGVPGPVHRRVKATWRRLDRLVRRDRRQPVTDGLPGAGRWSPAALGDRQRHGGAARRAGRERAHARPRRVVTWSADVRDEGRRDGGGAEASSLWRSARPAGRQARASTELSRCLRSAANAWDDVAINLRGVFLTGRAVPASWSRRAGRAVRSSISRPPPRWWATARSRAPTTTPARLASLPSPGRWRSSSHLTGSA